MLSTTRKREEKRQQQTQQQKYLYQYISPTCFLTYLDSLKQKKAEYRNKIEPIIKERTDRIKAGMSIDVLLSDLFRLKEDQRKIRQLVKVAFKVENATNMSSCFVDYVVNFGMAETEVQWREHLSKNDNLAAPIHMTRSNLDTNLAKKNATFTPLQLISYIIF